LFLYNWEVRDEWFYSLNDVPNEELLKDRNAGIGSILKTLLHIVDVEYSWVRAIHNKPDISHNIEDYISLESIKTISDQYRIEILNFLNTWTKYMEHEVVKPSWTDEVYKMGEILRHLIAHEIHHVGQLSVWAKELGIRQVNSSFIGRGLLKNEGSL